MGNPQVELPEGIQAFYTVESKDNNQYSQYVKKIRLFDKKMGLTLPNSEAVLWRNKRGSQPAPLSSGPVSLSYTGTLTEEQAKVCVKAESRFAYGYGGGLIVMKTGRGKSHVIMKLAQVIGKKALILAHSLKTASELKDKFKEYCGYETGIIGGGKKIIKDITVCSHDSFVMAEGKIGDFEVIFYDEADYNLSKDMLISLCRSGARYLYGFTGTPYRKDLDQNDMEKIFGEKIMVADQAGGGYNELPSIRVVKYKSGKTAEFQRFDELKTWLVRDDDRLVAQLETVSGLISEGRKCILMLTERVEEAGLWMVHLQRTGIPCFVISGFTTADEDKRNMDAMLAAGKPFAICATVGKMARGADVPPIDTVCLFSALQFRGTVVQAVGRALRKFPGKLPALIVDWNDLPVLSRQASLRRTAYRKEYGKDVALTQVEHERNRKLGTGQLSLSSEGVQAGERIPNLVGI